MKKAFINANLFDATDDCELQSGMTVVVDGEKIADIGKTGEVSTEGCKVIDLDGKYLLPGLINLHAHLFGTGAPSKMLGGGGLQKAVVGFAKTALGHKVLDTLAKASVTASLNSGVTTIRSSGDFCYSDVRTRDRINAGKFPGPRLMVPGPAITCVGGHGDGTFSRTDNDPDVLASFVKENADNNVDCIKICVTGGVMDAKVKGEPGEVKMTPEQVKAVCDRAHELGYHVASHTESSKGIKVALEGGVDTIEHGSFLDDELTELFKEKGAAFIVTTSPALPLAKLPGSITKLNELCIYNSEVVLDGMIQGAKTAMANGIPVGLGTDESCPLVTPYNMWREVWYFAKYYDVSNAYALRTATLGNARIVKLDGVTGSIESGKSADMIVVEKNPLDDLKALSKMNMVIYRGNVIDNPQVKKNAQIEEWLDSLM